MWDYANRLKPVEGLVVDAEKLAIGFAEWIHTNNWQALQWRHKNVWIDCEAHDYMVNGSPHHYDELLKVGKSTPDLLTMYLNEKQKG
jgi:hypothetical protein